MLIKEIEKVREQLYDMLIKHDFRDDEVIRISVKLDALILRYLNEFPNRKVSKLL